MEPALSDTFLACRVALTGDRPHRVWSLIVTIFGDMAQAPGMRLSGTFLGQVTEMVGIRPEAMRVALHRLRKDGWIESRREGRSSAHFLTEYGREQSAAASPRIYGPDPADTADMHLLVADETAPEARRALEAYALTDAYVLLGSNVLVGRGAAPMDAEALLVIGTRDMSVPDWVRRRVCSAELETECVRLSDAFGVVLDRLDEGGALAQGEAIALRILVVHSWRRLLFRHPNLPRAFFPVDWRGSTCRAQVREILSRLPLEARERPDALAVPAVAIRL